MKSKRVPIKPGRGEKAPPASRSVRFAYLEDAPDIPEAETAPEDTFEIHAGRMEAFRRSHAGFR